MFFASDVFKSVIAVDCEAIRVQEVMFIFELFRVIVLSIDIRCIICYRVTIMKQISSGNAIMSKINAALLCSEALSG